MLARRLFSFHSHVPLQGMGTQRVVIRNTNQHLGNLKDGHQTANLQNEKKGSFSEIERANLSIGVFQESIENGQSESSLDNGIQRGLFAKYYFRKNDTIALLPNTAACYRANILTNERLQHTLLETTAKIYDAMDLKENILADDLQYIELAILLLFEINEVNSKWKFMFEMWPNRVTNAATLQPHEIEKILGKNHPKMREMVNACQQYQFFLHTVCKHPLIQPVLKQIAKLYYNEDMDVARAMFFWAVSIVDSRSFRGSIIDTTNTLAINSDVAHPSVIGMSSQTQYLFPFFELLNHPSEGSVGNVVIKYLEPPSKDGIVMEEWIPKLKSAGVPKDFIVTKQGLRLVGFRALVATRDIAEGEELTYPYISMESSIEDQDYDLLYGFGFIVKRIEPKLEPTMRERIAQVIVNNNSLRSKVDRLQPINQVKATKRIAAAAKLGANIGAIRKL